MTSTPVDPFYDPGPAPPPIPLLSAQIPLSYDEHLVSMVAQEELHRRPGRRRVNFRDATPYRSLSPPTDRDDHSTIKSTQRRGKNRVETTAHRSRSLRNRNRHSSSPSPEDPVPSRALDTSESELSDDSESSVETIPRPPGGPGRPESGGYNLAAAMNWNATTFKKLQDRAHALIERHLDVTETYSHQDDQATQKVRDSLLAEFPDLAKFSGYWPVNDLMLMRLKALKAKIRKQTRMEAAGALLRGKPKGKSRAN